MKRQILVVDDYEVNRKILTKLLEDEYEVFTADTGLKALQLLNIRENKISAVLLDVVMPVMNGYEFLRRVRSDIRYVQLPIIVITQNDDSDSEVKALLAGASDYVPMPYNATVIMQRLKNLIRMNEAIENLRDAEKDALTGLYNKKAFYRLVQERMECIEPGQYVIMAVDIDKFKILNDSFGWEEGDHLLMVMSQCLRDFFDYSDAIIGYGDRDIFFVFVRREEISEEGFLQFERNVSNYFSVAKITLRVGIYVIDELDRKVRSMCDYALLAVNNIKGQFEARYKFFEPKMLEGILLEKRITDGMQESLENQNFEVYIQPKYDIESNLMIGAEALVRWFHPQLGRMSPGDFIPIFEKNGFITRLDWYVWEKVCECLSKWQREYGKIVPVSVNVSRKDVYSEGFPENLLNLVHKYGLTPECIHLEITETAYTENTTQLINILKKLKEYGFIIEMDDFGSGYSSLNILAELPIDIIKLDIKFIQSEIQNKNNNNIMKFVINLAKWMNLLVIAEGVETKKQLDYLSQLNCNFVQGYFYAKPMSIDDFEKRLVSEDILPIFDMKSYLNHLVEQKRDEGSGKEEILVVDDLAMNRAIIVDYLKEYYKMVQAENGEVALEYIKAHSENIVAVITDIYMPVMDGFELLNKIKSENEYDHICFIVTSCDEDLLRENKRLEMADDFILKPYEREEMIQHVKEVLDRRHKRELNKLRKIESEARRDRLTNLYNRDEFERQVTEFLSEDDIHATFLFVDVDNMRAINDAYGHDTGDEVIMQVAAKLNKVFREDDVISRFSGAKFAVLIKTVFEYNELVNRMNRLCNDLKFVVEDMDITCSIGVSNCPHDGKDYNSLFRHTDMALLAAKRIGGNRFIIYGKDDNLSPAEKKAHPKLLQILMKTSDNDNK